MSKSYDTDLNDGAWAIVEPHLPEALPGGRPRTTDLRAVVNAIFYLLRTGCQWRSCRVSFHRAAPSIIILVCGVRRVSGPDCNGHCTSEFGWRLVAPSAQLSSLWMVSQ